MTTPKKKRAAVSYCICCGAKFVAGKGWVEQHVSPCANQRHGWKFTTDKKPKK